MGCFVYIKRQKAEEAIKIANPPKPDQIMIWRSEYENSKLISYSNIVVENSTLDKRPCHFLYAAHLLLGVDPWKNFSL